MICSLPDADLGLARTFGRVTSILESHVGESVLEEVPVCVLLIIPATIDENGCCWQRLREAVPMPAWRWHFD